MKKLHLKTIEALQKRYGYADIQESINSGLCWKMEGSVGRHAMSLLDSGVCMLPLVARYDYYGNRVPSRRDLKNVVGSKGSLANCQNFWQGVIDGRIDIDA